jgi:hypothetical protein
MTPVPWHFVSTPLAVDVAVLVTGDPDWSRPARARLAEDPNGGPPTLITRGGPLAPRRLAIQMYVPHEPNLEARLDALRAAYNARGPYTLTTHRETVQVVFDASQGWRETDHSGYFFIDTALAEVG